MLDLATNYIGNISELLATAHICENCGIHYESLDGELWANLELVVKLSGPPTSISDPLTGPYLLKENDFKQRE